MDEKYKKYLQSPEWKGTAEKVRKRDGNRCVVCNKTKNLQVHHRTYDRIYEENLSDLTTLCDGCHDLFSKKTPSLHFDTLTLGDLIRMTLDDFTYERERDLALDDFDGVLKLYRDSFDGAIHMAGCVVKSLTNTHVSLRAKK